MKNLAGKERQMKKPDRHVVGLPVLLLSLLIYTSTCRALDDESIWLTGTVVAYKTDQLAVKLYQENYFFDDTMNMPVRLRDQYLERLQEIIDKEAEAHRAVSHRR